MFKNQRKSQGLTTLNSNFDFNLRASYPGNNKSMPRDPEYMAKVKEPFGPFYLNSKELLTKK